MCRLRHFCLLKSQLQQSAIANPLQVATALYFRAVLFSKLETSLEFRNIVGLSSMASEAEAGISPRRFFVAVHVGAGYHSPSNEKALRSAMKRACIAASAIISKVFIFFLPHSLFSTNEKETRGDFYFGLIG